MTRITNMAQLIYNNMTTKSNLAVGEMMDQISVTKTAVNTFYNDEEKHITYVISICNHTQFPYAVDVQDNLGAYEFEDTTVYPLEYVKDSLLCYVNGMRKKEALEVDTESGNLNIAGVPLAPGGNTFLVYDAVTTEFAPLGVDEKITNVVHAKVNSSLDVTDTEIIYTENGPHLSISKSISPVPARIGSHVTYTILIQNTGNTPAKAEDNVTLTDELDPQLKEVKVRFNGEAWLLDREYKYTDGLFETIPGYITVPEAAYEQDLDTGKWTTIPGVSTLTITGIL